MEVLFCETIPVVRAATSRKLIHVYRMKILELGFVFNNALRSSCRCFCLVFADPRLRISSWGLIIIVEIFPRFLSPFRKMLGQYLEADHEHFLLRI